MNTTLMWLAAATLSVVIAQSLIMISNFLDRKDQKREAEQERREDAWFTAFEYVYDREAAGAYRGENAQQQANQEFEDMFNACMEMN